MNEPNDGLDVFADVITGTLGIVILTALFFAVRALVTTDGLAGVEVRPELRARLLDVQLDVAGERQQRLDVRAATLPAGAAVLPERVTDDSGETDAVEAALRRDVVRQKIRQVELSVLEEAALREVEVQRERTDQAIESYVQTCGAAPLPVTVSTASRRPFYLFVSEGRVQPLYLVRDEKVLRNTDEVGWAVYDEGRRLRAYPRPGKGWNLPEAASALQPWTKLLGEAGWEVRLLVRGSDFSNARRLLRTLSDAGIASTWQPLAAHDYIEFAAGAIPDA